MQTVARPVALVPPSMLIVCSAQRSETDKRDTRCRSNSSTKAFRKLRPGVPLGMLHGKMKQMKRMGVFYKFGQSDAMVLFATDIAARGLDFPGVDWVLQVDCAEARGRVHPPRGPHGALPSGCVLRPVWPAPQRAYAILMCKACCVHMHRIIGICTGTAHAFGVTSPNELCSWRGARIPRAFRRGGRAGGVGSQKGAAQAARVCAQQGHQHHPPRLTSLMAKSDELKTTAQAAFVSYIRSVFLHANKGGL